MAPPRSFPKFLLSNGDYFRVTVDDAWRAMSDRPEPPPGRVRVFNADEIAALENSMKGENQ